MGDRIYLPGLGRFVQTDPVEGGNANSYVYPVDPVNGRDLDGNWGFIVAGVAKLAYMVYKAVKGAKVVSAPPKVPPPSHLTNTNTAINSLSYSAPSKVNVNIASNFKVPQFVPKVEKQVKNVFGAHHLVRSPNFAVKAAHHMEDPSRHVPVHILEQTINHGVSRVDPQGTRALMYTSQMWKNGKPYMLDVLYDKLTNSIWHFVYREMK